MAKKWPEMVVTRSFQKEHSFRITLYLQNVGKKEEVLVIKLQFVVVSVLFQPQLCKVTQRFFPKKSRESKNVLHSNVYVTISNPEVDISSIQKGNVVFVYQWYL